MYYLFDGSYTGYLTCVFESFAQKEHGAVPLTTDDFREGLFRESRQIVSQPEKAGRVYRGLQKKLGSSGALDFFRAFLSEDRRAWRSSFRIIRRVFDEGAEILSDYGDDDVLYFAQTLKKVSRERHRMKAFIRFQKSSDGLFLAVIEPDFNVLPLISDFFRKRYADQPWLIFDVKRAYGLLYDTRSVSEVRLTSEEREALSSPGTVVSLDENDAHFQQLWKLYYKSTNIESRRNMKLHLQHVPRRYWKYLPEK